MQEVRSCITFIDGMNKLEMIQELRMGGLVVSWLLTDVLGI